VGYPTRAPVVAHRPKLTRTRGGRSVLAQQIESTGRRPGYSGARADEYIRVGQHSVVIGVYWLGEDGRRREPLAFQAVTLCREHIDQIRDFTRRDRAMKAAIDSALLPGRGR
jgi:hypothetical protein